MEQKTIDSFITEIKQEKADNGWEDWLRKTLELFDCTTGTIHVFNKEDNILYLKAQVGVPESLLPKISEVPIGKGMAGIAAERKEAVQICNLQTDDSGVARPAAKDTKVEGAITLPMMLNGELQGTLGIAKKEPYEFSDEETKALASISKAICERAC